MVPQLRPDAPQAPWREVSRSGETGTPAFSQEVIVLRGSHDPAVEARIGLGRQDERAYKRSYNKRRRRGVATGTWLHPVPVDEVRPHLVMLRGLDVPEPVIASCAGVGVDTVRRVLQRKVSRVNGNIAAALLAVAPPASTPPGRVPVVGTARRLRSLCAGGWSLAELARRSGIARTTLKDWLHEVSTTVPAEAAGTVADLYDELYAVDGPCEATRDTARGHGWDQQVWLDEDIDDPAAAPLNSKTMVDPVAVERVLFGERSLAARLTKTEVAEVVRRGTAAGASQRDLAELLCTNTRQVCRIRARLRDADLPAAPVQEPTPELLEAPVAAPEPRPVHRHRVRPHCRPVDRTRRPGGRQPHRAGAGPAGHHDPGGAGRGSGALRPGLRRPRRVPAGLVGTRSRRLRCGTRRGPGPLARIGAAR